MCILLEGNNRHVTCNLTGPWPREPATFRIKVLRILLSTFLRHGAIESLFNWYEELDRYIDRIDINVTEMLPSRELVLQKVIQSPKKPH